MKDTASVSLEAKAAIVGAMYALERLFATSGRVGTNLVNVDALLGGGFKQVIQQYQYAARQVEVANEEVEASFIGIQEKMTKILAGEAPPKWIQYFAGKEKFTQQDILKYQQHPELLLQRLQNFAKNEKNAGLRNDVLESFVSKGMTTALVRNAFTPEALKRGGELGYSDKEIASLDRANIAWSNLGDKIQKVVGHLNAKFGGTLVNDISALVDKITPLANKFEELATKIELVKKVGLVFEGWGHIFDGISAVIDQINQLHGLPGTKVETAVETQERAQEKKPARERVADALLSGGQTDSLASIVIDVLSDIIHSAQPIASPAGKPAPSKAEAEKQAKVPAAYRTQPLKLVAPVPKVQVVPAVGSTITPKVVLPKLPHAPQQQSQIQNVEVNQTLNFTDHSKEPQKIGESVGKAANRAVRQSPAQGRVN